MFEGLHNIELIETWEEISQEAGQVATTSQEDGDSMFYQSERLHNEAWEIEQELTNRGLSLYTVNGKSMWESQDEVEIHIDQMVAGLPVGF